VFAASITSDEPTEEVLCRSADAAGASPVSQRAASSPVGRAMCKRNRAGTTTPPSISASMAGLHIFPGPEARTASGPASAFRLSGLRRASRCANSPAAWGSPTRAPPADYTNATYSSVRMATGRDLPDHALSPRPSDRALLQRRLRGLARGGNRARRHSVPGRARRIPRQPLGRIPRHLARRPEAAGR